MRLLLDQNLSWRLTAFCKQHFPGSAHIRDFDLTTADDRDLWAFAQREGYAIVTKDADFDDERAFPGPPPKLIRLTIGNASTDQIEATLRDSLGDLRAFATDRRRRLLLGRPR
jgi:predicted nuclease of predicted toxin-antitoxin system